MSQDPKDNPPQPSNEPGKRQYRFVHRKTDDPNDHSVEEWHVNEADLTKEDMNMLFQELVKHFNHMPPDVQEGFVAYIDYRIAAEQAAFKIGKTYDELNDQANRMIVTPNGLKFRR